MAHRAVTGPRGRDRRRRRLPDAALVRIARDALRRPVAERPGARLYEHPRVPGRRPVVRAAGHDAARDRRGDRRPRPPGHRGPGRARPAGHRRGAGRGRPAPDPGQGRRLAPGRADRQRHRPAAARPRAGARRRAGGDPARAARPAGPADRRLRGPDPHPARQARPDRRRERRAGGPRARAPDADHGPRLPGRRDHGHLAQRAHGRRSATAPTVSSGPSRVTIVLVAVAIALALSVGAAYVWDVWRRSETARRDDAVG